jgi:hypothetical protein
VRSFKIFAGFAIMGLAACSAVEGLPPLSNDTSDAGPSDALLIDAEPASADSSMPPSDAHAPADAGAQDATVPNDAQVDGDGAACLPEADGAFCARLGKNCGAVTAFDNCGARRTVASCGVCGSHFESCGGGWVANVCGCRPESDWSFCTRLGTGCGPASGVDNCGAQRVVATCGAPCAEDAGAADSSFADGGDPRCGARTCAPGAFCRQSDAGQSCACDFAGTGRIGDGTFCESPVQIEPAGAGGACVLTSGGRVGCWGTNVDGTLGTGDTLPRSSITWIPSSLLPPIATLEGNASSAGSGRSCALARDGRIFCWGRDAQFSSSNGTLTDSSTPVVFVDGAFASVRLIDDPPRSAARALCAETAPVAASPASTRCFAAGGMNLTVPTLQVVSASPTLLGWTSGSTVLWRGSGCSVVNAAGAYSAITNCTSIPTVTLAEQSALAGNIKLVDGLVRFTTLGEFASRGVTCSQSNYDSNTGFCRWTGVDDAWKGMMFRRGARVEVGIPDRPANDLVVALDPGEDIAVAGAGCVITTNRRFSCAPPRTTPQQ